MVVYVRRESKSDTPPIAVIIKMSAVEQNGSSIDCWQRTSRSVRRNRGIDALMAKLN